MSKHHFNWTAFALAGLLLFAQCSGRDIEGDDDPANDGTEQRHDGSDDNGAGDNRNSDDGDYDNGGDYVDDTITKDLKNP